MATDPLDLIAGPLEHGAYLTALAADDPLLLVDRTCQRHRLHLLFRQCTQPAAYRLTTTAGAVVPICRMHARDLRWQQDVAAESRAARRAETNRLTLAPDPVAPDDTPAFGATAFAGGTSGGGGGGAAWEDPSADAPSADPDASTGDASTGDA
jgi:hypothetical protein